MKSKAEVTRLIATMIGAVVGGAVGFWAFLYVFKEYDEFITSSGAITLLAVVVICGGGLVGGGYALLALHMLIERRMEKSEDDTPKYGRRNR